MAVLGCIAPGLPIAALISSALHFYRQMHYEMRWERRLFRRRACSSPQKLLQSVRGLCDPINSSSKASQASSAGCLDRVEEAIDPGLNLEHLSEASVENALWRHIARRLRVEGRGAVVASQEPTTVLASLNFSASQRGATPYRAVSRLLAAKAIRLRRTVLSVFRPSP